jgi:hypothetical protein
LKKEEGEELPSSLHAIEISLSLHPFPFKGKDGMRMGLPPPGGL